MLGGYGKLAAYETSKEFTDLPDHSELRIRAIFHFIDEWRGETGYFKVDDTYVWSMTYDLNNVKNPVDYCGD